MSLRKQKRDLVGAKNTKKNLRTWTSIQNNNEAIGLFYFALFFDICSTYYWIKTAFEHL